MKDCLLVQVSIGESPISKKTLFFERKMIDCNKSSFISCLSTANNRTSFFAAETFRKVTNLLTVNMKIQHIENMKIQHIENMKIQHIENLKIQHIENMKIQHIENMKIQH